MVFNFINLWNVDQIRIVLSTYEQISILFFFLSTYSKTCEGVYIICKQNKKISKKMLSGLVRYFFINDI